MESYPNVERPGACMDEIKEAGIEVDLNRAMQAAKSDLQNKAIGPGQHVQRADGDGGRVREAGKGAFLVDHAAQTRASA